MTVPIYCCPHLLIYLSPFTLSPFTPKEIVTVPIYIKVTPPDGMTSAQFDAAVVRSYNGLPSNLGAYNVTGNVQLFGTSNSNNAATSILYNAGVTLSTINQYQQTLNSANNKITPGLGTPTNADTYVKKLGSLLKKLKSTLNKLSSVLNSNK